LKTCLLNVAFVFTWFCSPAQPTISSFFPESGPVGTLITITGTGFSTVAADNIVFFGAVTGSVLSASSTSLVAEVPARASYQLITVTTGGLVAYSKKPFSVTFPSVIGMNAASFPVKTDISVGPYPAFILFKDLNNDGKPELIHASQGFSVHKNNSTPGTISFGPEAIFSTSSPNYITVEDMDGDGKPDIIQPDYNSPIRIFQNTSSGATISLSGPVSIANTAAAFGVSTQDLDGDGRPDLVTTNNESTGKFSIYRNTSSAGTISLSLTGNYNSVSGYPRGVSFGYINGDNKPDMIIATQNNGSVALYINTSSTGSISFAAPINFTMPSVSFPESISVGDFDGDGKDDFAVANNTYLTIGRVSVLRNLTVGATVAFAAPLNLETGVAWYPYMVTAGDLDGDGKPEIAVSNQFNNAVSIFKNNSTPGTLSFDLKFDLLRTGSPSRGSMAITDVDGDKRPDVISASYTPNVISIFNNNIQLLPVKFLTFTAVENNKDVLLNWTVANESVQTDRYEVERSFTGDLFQKQAVIQKNAAVAGHSYYYTDPDVFIDAGIKHVYYRIKQVDKDGNAIYSEIKHVDVAGETDILITIHPNPVSSMAVLNILVPEAQNISLSILDASGKIVRSNMSIKAVKGLNRKLIYIQDLEAGVYYIKTDLKNFSGTISVIKVNN
jgi:hypothetical protein